VKTNNITQHNQTTTIFNWGTPDQISSDTEQGSLTYGFSSSWSTPHSFHSQTVPESSQTSISAPRSFHSQTVPGSSATVASAATGPGSTVLPEKRSSGPSPSAVRRFPVQYALMLPPANGTWDAILKHTIPRNVSHVQSVAVQRRIRRGPNATSTSRIGMRSLWVR